MSETGQNDSVAMLGSGNGGYDSISCVSDLCRNNCAVCIANCGVHRLRRGVLDLVELLEADYFPDTHMCTVCVDEDVLSEADELGNTLNDITYELFAPRNNFQCVSGQNNVLLCTRYHLITHTHTDTYYFEPSSSSL